MFMNELKHTCYAIDGSKSHKKVGMNLEDMKAFVGDDAVITYCVDGPHYCMGEGDLRATAFKTYECYIVHSPSAEKGYENRAVLAPSFADHHTVYYGKVVVVRLHETSSVSDDHILRGIIPMYDVETFQKKGSATFDGIEYLW